MNISTSEIGTDLADQQNRFGIPDISTSDPALADQVEKLALVVLTEVLGANVSKPILCLHITSRVSALLDQLLDEEVQQTHALNSRNVGPISGDVQSRGIVDA